MLVISNEKVLFKVSFLELGFYYVFFDLLFIFYRYYNMYNVYFNF